MVTSGQSYSKHVPIVIGAVMAERCRTAVRYVAPNFIVKCTRAHQSDLRANARSQSLLVTFGRPNYAERAFIKDALAAGEPFPVRKVQLQHYKKGPWKATKAEKVARKLLYKGKKLTDRERKTLAAAALRR